MPCARRQGNHVGQTQRDSGLSVVICTPACHPAIQPKRQAVVATGGYNHRIGQVRRHIALPLIIFAPGQYRPIAAQRQAMPGPGGDRDRVGGNCRDAELAQRIIASYHERHDAEVGVGTDD